jgi:hypothetical protein
LNASALSSLVFLGIASFSLGWLDASRLAAPTAEKPPTTSDLSLLPTGPRRSPNMTQKRRCVKTPV